ncbi:hypothetical protein [Hoeflea sp. TYP-13]|uniref:hypothetical protein n=1 Tax=Hoeflea sp. TYP-13 TaxID=3230023 RepID=UPI0034C67F7C
MPLVITFIVPLVVPAAADDRAVFYGTWGTAKQCSRAPIRTGGTVLKEPFVISSGWLRQGRFWCRLNWGPVEPREHGFFTGAHAQCGEDTARGYFLGMILSGDDLTLRWGFPLSNGPLRRCSGR